MATVKHVPVKNLTPKEIQQLETLTMSIGLMRGRLHSCLRNPVGSHVYYIELRGKIIAWALLWHRGPYKRGLYLYVHEKARRRGFGTLLCNYVAFNVNGKGRKKLMNIRVYPWDHKSDSFYNHFDQFSK